MKKDAGAPRPWTADALLGKYHFCNVFRRLDRTSLVVFDLIREQPDFAHRVEAAILGRLINRADTVPWGWIARRDRDELRRTLVNRGINTNAYRLNTPRGLNNYEGLLDLIQEPRIELAEKLLDVTSLKQANDVMDKVPYIRGFVGYQILLDLYETESWPEGFDGEWALAGPGAWRGLLYLFGEEQNYDWTNSEFRWGNRKDTEENILRYMQQLTRVVQAQWPKDWPEFSIHETEFMLCELDKYVRKSLVQKPSGRLYKGSK